MAEVTFAYVPIEGFAAFDVELSSGAWGAVEISPYLGADGRAVQPLGTAPVFIALKIQLFQPIANVVRAMSGAGTAKLCDNAWDGTQKLLHNTIAVGLASRDAAKRAAAERLQKLLLLGDGEKQTQLTYQQEVDFGRNQIRIMTESPHAADVTLLGLQPVVTELAATTNALAQAIGHGETGLPPAKRKRAATAACVAAFGAVARQLEWLTESGMEGVDRQMAVTLHDALVELAMRYPRPTSTKAQAMPPAVN